MVCVIFEAYYTIKYHVDSLMHYNYNKLTYDYVIREQTSEWETYIGIT